MTNRRRVELIEKYLRDHRYADLHTLSTRFRISVSTVRRALDELESRGSARRHHGGASAIDSDEVAREYDFIARDQRNADEKFVMARFIAERVLPGMTVIIDGGTSPYAVARLLIGKRLNVITNSLPVAGLLSDVSSIETIVTGGTIHNRIGVLVGPHCDEMLERVHADIAILGAVGVTAEGMWAHNPPIAATQKRMVEAADQCIFAVDHSKFGRKAPILATGFAENHTIVTDSEPPAEVAAAMRAARATLALCPRG
ncbi:DeoR/GlpR family DNA-binding transcription regulator [Synoicihabitans lomoniglobus]|uniref:DeoR/GlpR family DNA-binding transcription regulator n=1 Tax=Synoicihabitans lomoniglobus TaxID=2909285 RepID=A0AAF0CQT2_9BACT|nr:DeoR/GlpR family DNA-binding transcription regulator [Opitutaceae bacterium LMO-M01]WED66291.1 DeoR/GlpR family DNA-binding transcription regulator [Opitutaceae bacterium LMO-M01]